MNISLCGHEIRFLIEKLNKMGNFHRSVMEALQRCTYQQNSQYYRINRNMHLIITLTIDKMSKNIIKYPLEMLIEN